ncbi:hydrophobin [Melanogaster broomeanus]|nr:hydrophobin [Melanogaster broomeanus]
MFIRTSSIVLPIVALAAVATAAPSLEARDQCNTGSISCCANTYTSTDTTLTQLAGLLGIVLPDVSGFFALGCSPLILGVGATCTQQPVCCTGNTINGLINVGCSPINIGL